MHYVLSCQQVNVNKQTKNKKQKTKNKKQKIAELATGTPYSMLTRTELAILYSTLHTGCFDYRVVWLLGIEVAPQVFSLLLE